MDPLSFFLGFISAFIFIAGLFVIGALIWVVGFMKHRDDKDKKKGPMKAYKSKRSIIVDTKKF